MRMQPSNNLWVIAITILVGLLLTIIPLPTWADYVRPAWVILILIYWSMVLPDRVGVGAGWISGLLLDALQGVLLGEFALVCTLAVFITSQLHTRVRIFPLLQQCIFIFLLVGISYFITVWIQGISGQPVQGWLFGLTVVVSTLIWPIIFAILEWVRMRFKVR
jgi:rod shape-determining protein MreD